MTTDSHFKDQVLDSLAAVANVAQFVSFDVSLHQRFCRVHGYEANHPFLSPGDAVRALLEKSPETSVNVRTFDPADPKSREFLYGLSDAAEVTERLRSFAANGLHTIVNETVDINDGGVSGVALGQVVEFAPGDTPRCVEKPGTAAMPRATAEQLFRTVYGLDAVLPGRAGDRVEFSIHPLRRGYRHEHVIVWEIEDVGVDADVPQPAIDVRWPNRFSRFIGDKAFGLLMGALAGLDVPETVVIARNVAPFRFGAGGSAETWIRTAPVEQEPGRFTTRRGWTDPFALLAAEDPAGTAIASVLCQRGIDAHASGAALAESGGGLRIEGVYGFGDEFMIGRRAPDVLPEPLLRRVRDAYAHIAARFGPARFEWVDDGSRTWIVQLHCGASISTGTTIVPGDPPAFRRFDVADGLSRLRELIDDVRRTGEGIVVVGGVGVTSHFGDVLRRARIPSRFEMPSE